MVCTVPKTLRLPRLQDHHQLTCQGHSGATVQKGHLSRSCCIMPFSVMGVNQLHGENEREITAACYQKCSSSEIQVKHQRFLLDFFHFANNLLLQFIFLYKKEGAYFLFITFLGKIQCFDFIRTLLNQKHSRAPN